MCPSGDFNIDMLVDLYESREFCGILASYGFQNTVHVLGRITGNCSTLLDLFITNVDLDITAETIIFDIRNHMPIFTFIDNTICRVNDSMPILTQFINKSSLQLF